MIEAQTRPVREIPGDDDAIDTAFAYLESTQTAKETPVVPAEPLPIFRGKTFPAARPR